jgi:hypothetical protein
LSDQYFQKSSAKGGSGFPRENFIPRILRKQLQV